MTRVEQGEARDKEPDEAEKEEREELEDEDDALNENEEGEGEGEVGPRKRGVVLHAVGETGGRTAAGEADASVEEDAGRGAEGIETESEEVAAKGEEQG